MLRTLQQLADRYTTFGLDGLPEGEKSKRYAFAVVCLLGGGAALAYAVYYAAYDFVGLRLMWITSLACAPVLALPLIARHSVISALSIGVLIVICVFTFMTYLTGVGSGLFMYMFAGILATVLVCGTDHRIFALSSIASMVIAMLVCLVLFAEPSGMARVDPFFQKMTFASVIFFFSVMLSAGIYSLAVRVSRAEAALAAEHARSEALLQNLLPDEIASRLKDRPGEVIADGLPAVTLLFADIVDFTPRSARMAPEQLVGFLNRIFSTFDELTAERGLEKIKTIGDAYMVAAGLPVARADHAEVIADMALAMQRAAVRLSEELGEELGLRIGIHSGPAIAGVIGTSKVFYDVWGDTVNTASRMESHGEPGKIQLTVATRAILKGTFAFTPRGPVAIKGVGQMETWWLDGRV